MLYAFSHFFNFEGNFYVVDMRRCCYFLQARSAKLLREPSTCTHVKTCILYENKVNNFSLEEACENNTSSPSPRLCHFGGSRHFAVAEKGASELQGYFGVSVE